MRARLAELGMDVDEFPQTECDGGAEARGDLIAKEGRGTDTAKSGADAGRERKNKKKPRRGDNKREVR